MGKQKNSKIESEMHKEANGGRDEGVKCAVCPVWSSRKDGKKQLKCDGTLANPNRKRLRQLRQNRNTQIHSFLEWTATKCNKAEKGSLG